MSSNYWIERKIIPRHFISLIIKHKEDLIKKAWTLSIPIPFFIISGKFQMVFHDDKTDFSASMHKNMTIDNRWNNNRNLWCPIDEKNDFIVNYY